MVSVKGYRRFTVGTIRGRSVLAGIVLLLVLGGMAFLAIWRTSQDRRDHDTIERRSAVLANLEEARAQIYLSGASLATAALSDQPFLLIDSYHTAIANGEASLARAKTLLSEDGDLEAVSVLEGVNQQLEQLLPTFDSLSEIAISVDAASRASSSLEYLPKLWPSVNPLLSDLGGLTAIEQTRLADAANDANRKAGDTLWILAAFGATGFLVGLAVVANLIHSVVRPLASLQRSVRAVASGDMNSRAEVCGPREVASLAADFNAMIVQLKGATDQMRHLLEVESAVAGTSTLLARAEDIDTGLRNALRVLAEAVGTEHAYIFMFKDGNTKMQNTHEWNVQGKKPQPERFADVDCATFGWWVGQLERNEEVVIENVSDLPSEAAAEREILERMKANSALAVPFGPAGKPDGFVGFGDTRVTHVWRKEDIRMLRLASESISSSINRARAERALRESEERFRTLSSSAPVGIFLTDSSGGSVYVNKRMLSISGMALDQALGFGWTTAVHSDDRERVLKEQERANRENDEFAQDFRIATPRGNIRWVSAHSRPIGSDGARVGTLEDITERKQAEDALRQSEERFRTLGASAPIGIFQTDVTGKTIFQNDRLQEMLNQSFGSARPWVEAIHPDDRRKVIEEVIKSVGEGVEFAREFRVLTPDDIVHWVRAHARGLRSGDGQLTGVVGTIEDVTERKQAESELRRSEERFRTLGASAPIGIFHADATGKLVFVNERFVEISGESLRDEGCDWYDVVHPDDRGEVIRGVVEAVKTRGEFVREFRLLTPYGVTRWVSAHARNLRDGSGRFLGLIGTIEDVTDRRAREEALCESEARFRSLSASAPIGILLADADDVIKYTNECLRDIMGLRPSETLENLSRPHVLSTFAHPDDRREVIDAHEAALARSTYEFLREFRIVTPQGETRWVRAHVIPIAEGRQNGRVGTIEDITEHKMLEEERQNAYEGTTLLLAMAAEARDPYTEHHLFRIRGYSEALALQMGLSPEMAKRIGLASLLHDIGKTRVPDAILTKPGPLTEAEWQVMRRHTVWGEELLPASTWFTTAREIARSHHENWDGTGYPDCLRGDQIPLAATIVAVADGFDAMTSKRPYKGAWPPARAMRELRNDNGHRYSRHVVEAFERAVAEGAIAQIAGIRRSKLSDLLKAA